MQGRLAIRKERSPELTRASDDHKDAFRREGQRRLPLRIGNAHIGENQVGVEADQLASILPIATARP